MKIGDRLPAIELSPDTGEKLNLDRLEGPVVLFFFPMAFSKICTDEACHFRDLAGEFAAMGATVCGISPDDSETLARYRKEHALQFPTVSDPDRKVAHLFGAVGLFGIVKRLTIVADRTGRIVLSFSSLFQSGAHADRALKAVRELADQA